MARPPPKMQLEAIIRARRRHPEGAHSLQIGTALASRPPFQNLQRWISALVAQGWLVRIGATNSVRYRYVDAATAGPASDICPWVPAATPATQALQTLVGQPIAARPPKNYHREWLVSYVPDATLYLSADVRALSRNVRPLSRNVPPLSANVRPADAMLSRIVADLA